MAWGGTGSRSCRSPSSSGARATTSCRQRSNARSRRRRVTARCSAAAGRRLLGPLADARVAAVAGTAEVGNLENGLTRCQALEYLVQQELERRAWDALGALPVVPGAVGAWRRSAVAAVGGFSSETLAEDADLAMALCRAGWRVVHAPEARARTEAPETAAALVKQRVRWSFGIL